MKYRFGIAAFLLTTLVSSSFAAPSELDRVVAIVNESAIANSELQDEMEAVRAQLKAKGATPPEEVLRKQVLERLILKHIKIQLADRNNIVVEDETLNQTLNRIASQNDISLAQLRNILGKDGLDFNAYREGIRHDILHNRLRQRYVDNRITVTEAEVKQFLQKQKKHGESEDEFRLSHILISLPEGASTDNIQQAKTKGGAVLSKLNSGEPFAQVAIAESDGQMALEGGDLGWRKLGEIPSLFANIVLDMNVGDISELIRSPSGFHIIQLAEQRGGERYIVTQTHARHILIKTNEIVSDDDAQRKLFDLKSRIENGDDFSELAKAHSDDTGSAAKGGDLGWANPGQMVPAFERIMDSHNPGKISNPFQSRFGWHILEVLDRRDHDDTEQFQRNNARKQLYDRKVAEEEELWLRRLRDEAYVETRL